MRCIDIYARSSHRHVCKSIVAHTAPAHVLNQARFINIVNCFTVDICDLGQYLIQCVVGRAAVPLQPRSRFAIEVALALGAASGAPGGPPSPALSLEAPGMSPRSLRMHSCQVRQLEPSVVSLLHGTEGIVRIVLETEGRECFSWSSTTVLSLGDFQVCFASFMTLRLN